MLEELLLHIHNKFECGIVAGEFSVTGKTLDVPGLQAGQYYWVDGSVFNDGLHQHPDTKMTDEDFEGAVTFMAVPKAVVDIAEEIGGWVEANKAAIDSPYQSESFDGYSYSKGGGSLAGGGSATWQDHFASRLNPWRKIA